MLIPIDEVVYFDCITTNPSTGAVSDADSTPTFEVFEEGTDTDIGVGGNLTKRTSKTGNYRGSFTASAANGFEAGKWYSVVVSATVNSVAGKDVARSFRCCPAESAAGVVKVDPSHWNGTAVATPDTAGYPKITIKAGTGTGELNVSGGKAPATIAAGDIATDAITAAAVKADAVTKIQNGLATPTNITAGTITTVTNLTNAPPDSSGVTTLVSRLTIARAGYLDNLNVGGVVASQADITAINQSASRRVILTTLQQFERPESSSTSFVIEARTYDGDGAAVNADSTPTLTATGTATGSLAAHLSSATNPATGVYRWTYTVEDDATLEQILFGLSATIGSSTFTMTALSQVCDFVAATFTTTDRANIEAILEDTGTTIPASIAALPTDADVKTQAASALTDYDPPTRAEATSDKQAILDAVAALPDESVIADAVLDEALAGHTDAGSLGKAVADILVDTGETLPAQIAGISTGGGSVAGQTFETVTIVLFPNRLTTSTNLNEFGFTTVKPELVGSEFQFVPHTYSDAVYTLYKVGSLDAPTVITPTETAEGTFTLPDHVTSYVVGGEDYRVAASSPSVAGGRAWDVWAGWVPVEGGDPEEIVDAVLEGLDGYSVNVQSPIHNRTGRITLACGDSYTVAAGTSFTIERDDPTLPDLSAATFVFTARPQNYPEATPIVGTGTLVSQEDGVATVRVEITATETAKGREYASEDWWYDLQATVGGVVRTLKGPQAPCTVLLDQTQ